MTANLDRQSPKLDVLKKNCKPINDDLNIEIAHCRLRPRHLAVCPLDWRSLVYITVVSVLQARDAERLPAAATTAG